MASAEDSFTSSLRSAEATAVPITGFAGGSWTSLRRRALARGEGHAGLGAFELAEADGLADMCRVPLRGLLPEETEDAGDPADRPVRAHQLGAVADRSREDAGDRQLAAMRGVHGLHHLDDRVAAAARYFQPRARVGDARRLVADRLEQPADPVAALGGTDQHRADQAGAHLDDEVGKHLFAFRLDVLEELLHQPVVVVGKLLEHGEAGLGLLRPVIVASCRSISLAACSR